MTVQSSLSQRGTEYSNRPDFRETFGKLIGDAFDPVKNPDGYINIGVAENFAMIPEIAAHVNSHKIEFPLSSFSYGEGFWGTQRLRNAMAKFIDNHFSPLHRTDPEQLIFAAGITSISEMLAFTIADKGDAILFPRPIYQGFNWDLAARAHVKMVFAEFGDVDQFSTQAVHKYEEALKAAEAEGTKVRALMLCNPHNPLGQCYPKDTIIAMMKLCKKYKIHLICDEVYATSVYDVGDPKAVPFTSALSFDYSQYIDAEYVHVLYGLSKDLAAGGTRLGCIYVQNEQLHRAMLAIGMFHWPAGPSQEVATAVLEDEAWCEEFLARARTRLASRNKLARRILDDAGIKYHTGANAGFFLWIDLSPWLPNDSKYKDEWEREAALNAAIWDKKVFLTQGSQLSAEKAGFFRLIFSQNEEVLKTGLQRIFDALAQISRRQQQQQPQASDGDATRSVAFQTA